MAKKIQLTIAEPCHENWEQMNPVEKGRFCGSCQKQVVDFSTMSDREIAVFFKKPSTGSVCGRFMHDQLDRDMEIPKKRIPWVKYFFQFALPAFLFSLKANSQQVRMGKPAIRTTVPAQPVRTLLGDTTVVRPVSETKPVVCNAPSAAPLDVTTKETIIKPDPKINTTGWVSKTMIWGAIKFTQVSDEKINLLNGKVLDEFGDPVAYANIMIDGGKRVQADSDGIFTITPSRKWKKMNLDVTAAGFIEKSREVIRKEQGSDELIINLTSNAILPEVKINSYTISKSIELMGLVSEVSKKVKVPVEKKGNNDPALLPDDPIKNDKPAMLNIYPNPVISGSTLNIGCRDIEEGYYTFQILSLSGQVVRHRELWVDDKAVVLNMEVPKIAAGIYLLRMINKKSGKNLTEKIVVQ
jgi:hypothetical protein